MTDSGSDRDPSRIWSTDPALELSHYTARRAFPLHFHAEGIVSVIVSGAATVCVDGRCEVADEGSIVVLEPERAHLCQPVGAGGVRCAERLSWNDLARPAGVSAAHLARRFRAHFGIPPHLYQVQYRIARAKRLIQRRLGLARIALGCGFSDQSHFTHEFTRYVGQTPGAFLRAQDSTRT